MRVQNHRADFCVVGGGLSGMCAAVAAARHGARVVLVHDRPVPGGNASSEIRMWICGAHGKDHLETGLLEEIQLDNLRYNPTPSYACWDMVLYSFLRRQPGLTVLYNTAVSAARMDGDRVVEISGYQTTSETVHHVEATLFADCSGDSVLAPLTGAEFRVGREAASEFGEDIEPPTADRRTMGMSCLIQAREHDGPQPFTPPPWAHHYASADDLPNRHLDVNTGQNFWWIELGGEFDSIHDTEMLRDRLLSVSYGVWDLMKNRHPGTKDKIVNMALDWVGFLPGKRESRRLMGDHILTQNDVRAEGRFDDLIAYGGWSMDDHHPGGVASPEKPTIFHPAPSPYGIPYRCCYSRNVANLFMAGRNISTTHAALSSTRVMATCAVLGQAVGTAAALATRHKTTPRGVYENHLTELRQTLMDDDAWLPWSTRAVPEATRNARLEAQWAGTEPMPTATRPGDLEALRSGADRPEGETANAWDAAPGLAAAYLFDAPTPVSEARMVFDSNLNRAIKNMPCNFFKDTPGRCPPATLVRSFIVQTRSEPGGAWHDAAKVDDNHQRLVRVPLHGAVYGVRLVPLRTWGDDGALLRVFAFDVR